MSIKSITNLSGTEYVYNCKGVSPNPYVGNYILVTADNKEIHVPINATIIIKEQDNVSEEENNVVKEECLSL